jgi:hypothetical protein
MMQPPSMAARPMMIVIFRIAALLRCSFEFSAIQAPAAFDKVFADELKLLRLLGGIEVDNVRLSAQDRSSAMRIDAGPDRFAVLCAKQAVWQVPAIPQSMGVCQCYILRIPRGSPPFSQNLNDRRDTTTDRPGREGWSQGAVGVFEDASYN